MLAPMLGWRESWSYESSLFHYHVWLIRLVCLCSVLFSNQSDIKDGLNDCFLAIFMYVVVWCVLTNAFPITNTANSPSLRHLS
jgi:hypothetical protein